MLIQYDAVRLVSTRSRRLRRDQIATVWRGGYALAVRCHGNLERTDLSKLPRVDFPGLNQGESPLKSTIDLQGSPRFKFCITLFGLSTGWPRFQSGYFLVPLVPSMLFSCTTHRALAHN